MNALDHGWRASVVAIGNKACRVHRVKLLVIRLRLDLGLTKAETLKFCKETLIMRIAPIICRLPSETWLKSRPCLKPIGGKSKRCGKKCPRPTSLIAKANLGGAWQLWFRSHSVETLYSQKSGNYLFLGFGRPFFGWLPVHIKAINMGAIWSSGRI